MESKEGINKKLPFILHLREVFNFVKMPWVQKHKITFLHVFTF